MNSRHIHDLYRVVCINYDTIRLQSSTTASTPARSFWAAAAAAAPTLSCHTRRTVNSGCAVGVQPESQHLSNAVGRHAAPYFTGYRLQGGEIPYKLQAAGSVGTTGSSYGRLVKGWTTTEKNSERPTTNHAILADARFVYFLSAVDNRDACSDFDHSPRYSTQRGTCRLCEGELQ